MIRMFFIFVLLAVTNFAQEKLEGTAPNFGLENLEGDVFELSEFVGKGPVLLSFWATWCKPCVEELKAYNKIYLAFKEQGFTLVAISVDSERSISKVKPYISSMGYEFPVLLDPNSDVARLYYARQVPYTVMIDKDGNILFSHIGYSWGDEIKVEEIVKQQFTKENVGNIH